MILWCIIIAALVILDQVTKILVAGNMILHESIPVIPKLFSLTYIQKTVLNREFTRSTIFRQM